MCQFSSNAGRLSSQKSARHAALDRDDLDGCEGALRKVSVGQAGCPTAVGREHPLVAGSGFPLRLRQADLGRLGPRGESQPSWRCLELTLAARRGRSRSSACAKAGSNVLAATRLPRPRRQTGPSPGSRQATSVASAHAIMITPDTFVTTGPAGNSFSARTRSVRAAIQTRFMTPPTKSSAIIIQQQPTQ